ncbi:glycosyltransferase family 2 protein [uncultured Chryseobacterium sp.]|uniref:glycosyltransferase family 2 protein n=1 Tax=uncultured Chryseobacterium sp. TaxID=259322 RepID=UPI0025F02C56|nr:glycosyltransferase family 2 protein [uncultured Chryseobacterium sp.]
MNPKVSVIMLTYNHAPYLKQAIEGVLSQQTDFPFELIICNDHSPDNTDEVVKDFTEKYPGIIKYYKHETNIGFVENQRFAFTLAKGEYMAYCEGDDYWTDLNKLQFQTDFLDKNPDYVMTTARNLLFHQNDGHFSDDGKTHIFRDKDFVDYTQDSFFKERPTQTFTYLIRRKYLDFKWIDIYPDYRDLYYFYHLLEFGKGRAFNHVIGVYRLHDGGIYSSLKIENQYRTSINIFSNIKRINHDNRANRQIITDLDQLILKYYYKKEFKIPLVNLHLYKAVFERFFLSGHFKTLIMQLFKIMKYTLKR